MPTFDSTTTNEPAGGSAPPDMTGYVHRPSPSKSRLVHPDYKQLDLFRLHRLSTADAYEYFVEARWSVLGYDVQACPHCGVIDRHNVLQPNRVWKCRDKLCRKEFTVFSGTPFHGLKIAPAKLIGMLFSFVESKDSRSAREFSGENQMTAQSAWLTLMKVREALAITLEADGPLSGRIEADAAYFMKYLRPPNKGTGLSASQKKDQKNAGLDEHGKAKRAVSPRIHALVVFAETGPYFNRYRVGKLKVENQRDLDAYARRFVAPGSTVITDQHTGYSVFSDFFPKHVKINNSEHFVDKDGNHTNNAEGFFSRMRAAVAGAWHHMDLRYLEYYGWEFAWRQQMVVRDNSHQLADLLSRIMRCPRSVLFENYYGKDGPRTPYSGESGAACEVPASQVKRRPGRPQKAGDRRSNSPAADIGANAAESATAAPGSESAEAGQSDA